MTQNKIKSSHVMIFLWPYWDMQNVSYYREDIAYEARILLTVLFVAKPKKLY